MIKVTLRNIKQLDLPLDNSSKIVKRGISKKILKQLEKKYNLKSHYVCSKAYGFRIYENAAFHYIPDEDKQKWITNYEIYVRSSLVYKFWIWFYGIKK